MSFVGGVKNIALVHCVYKPNTYKHVCVVNMYILCMHLCVVCVCVGPIVLVPKISHFIVNLFLHLYHKF